MRGECVVGQMVDTEREEGSVDLKSLVKTDGKVVSRFEVVVGGDGKVKVVATKE